MIPRRIQLSRLALALGMGLVVAGCTLPDSPVEIFDPYEPRNRAVHAFNKGLDTVALRPASQVYGAVLPEPARDVARNFASNLSQPRYVVNDLLQGNLEDATHNLLRFVVNTTIGLGGLFDPAGSSFALAARSTDFEETLFTWGVPEGAYLERPFFGPGTERAFVGTITDFFLDPLGALASADEAEVLLGGRVTGIVDTRYRLGSALDGILYESADSYAQSRSLYLQNRRFQLGDTADDFSFDPYAFE